MEHNVNAHFAKISFITNILITTFFPLQLLIVPNYFYYVQLLTSIIISNYIFGRAIWDKLSECIFENS